MDETSDHDTTRFAAASNMGHTSRSSSASALMAPRSDAYWRDAESAAREAEFNSRAAALRRLERDAVPADPAAEAFFDLRLVTPREHELPDRVEEAFIDAKLVELR